MTLLEFFRSLVSLSGFRITDLSESDRLKPVLLLPQQIRAIAPRFFQGHLQAPAANFFVISAEKDFWHVPAAKFGGARVVRAVEEKVIGD